MTIFIVIINSILISCGTQSELYRLYTNSFYDLDMSILISRSDSTYIYLQSLHSSNIDYKEIGRVKCCGDTFFLIPACQIESDTSFYMCRYYDCKSSMYSNKEDLEKGKSKCVPLRVYVQKGDSITDCTLDFYYPNDSTGFSCYENYPLYEQKIKQSKKEKGVLHTRKVLDKIY